MIGTNQFCLTSAQLRVAHLIVRRPYDEPQILRSDP
jgi:hypothetical protein